MYQTDTVVNSTSFQRINIPGGGRFTVTGEPEMPYIRQLIAIPECDSVALSVNVTNSTTMQNYNIYPAPALVEVTNPDSSVTLEEEFSYDTVAYSTNQYYPQVNAEIYSIGYFRDQKYAEVFIYPVQFNPVTEEIYVNKEYEVTLTFINPSSAVNVNVGIFNNIATNTMLNYASTGISATINDNVSNNGSVQWITLTDPSQASTIVADYLIICSAPFFEPTNPDSEVLHIANHRATYNGFDVAILNANNIISDELGFYYENFPEPDNKEEQRIRTCIRMIYEGENAQNTYDGKIGYALLIGDVDDYNSGMPTSYDNTWSQGQGEPYYPSDYYYSCVTHSGASYDSEGDLFIGRFCVDNNLGDGLTELQNVVNKTIYYESEATFDGWRDETGVLLHIASAYHPIYFSFMDDLVPTYFTVDDIDGFSGDVEGQLYTILNEGVMTFTYFGHGSDTAWCTGNGISTDDLQTNLENEYKAPVVHGIACHTGHFDGLDDCLGEGMVTYSGTKGFTGYLGACRSVGYQISNTIYDPPKHFQELIPYTIFHDLSHITGEYILESKLLNTAVARQYKYAFNFFGDPALNVMAQGFEVTQDVVLPEITTISTEITVKNGATLIIPIDGELRFENNGKLIIEQGATLCINANAWINAINGVDSLIVYGELMMMMAENVNFEANMGTAFVIDIRNEDITASFVSATFENITLNCLSNSMTFNSCTANNSYIEVYKKNVNSQYFFTNQCSFSNTSLKACVYGTSYQPYAGNIEISNCNFANGSASSVIEISYFSNYLITGTTVSYDQGDGVSVYYSGKDLGSTHKISNCEIYFTGNFVCDVQGIKTYYSLADIENNYIHDNDIGLACLQKSSIRLLGNSQSLTEEETQRIKDNITKQVYCTDGNSLPYEFEYNSIYNDNANDFVVSMDNVVWGGYDIRNNYWGENFNPATDLDPPNAYSYLPVWEPLWAGLKSTDEAKVLFYSARQDIIDSNYAEAKGKFKQIIEDYSGSKYQNASVKEILLLTDLYDQDYTGLQDYLDTVPSLWENEHISDVTEYIMTWCDIRLENYPEAIDWFEDRILNPISYTDSILSIIDLGNVYLLMQDTATRRGGYTGKLSQYKPNSLAWYEENREYLIDLLCTHENVSQVSDERPTEPNSSFQQISPNPVVDGHININYFVSEDANVVINLYDVKGILITELFRKYQSYGDHSNRVYTTKVRSGLYYVTLEIDGKLKDYQKIVVIN